MNEPPQKRQVHRHRVAKAQHEKLAKLPPNAKVSKRPLLHPAIPSPYAGASQQKVIYVSARTPFLSAIKRVEKLLHLSDKRLVQSATTLAKQNKDGQRKRKRGAEDDEIANIAKEVEKQKSKRRRTDGGRVNVVGQNGGEEEMSGVGEEVLLKGTGKAIARVMEMGVWFQQREEEYVVRLRTGTVGAIDDIEVDEEGEEVATKVTTRDAMAGSERVGDAEEAGVEDMDVDGGPANEGGALLEREEPPKAQTAQAKGGTEGGKEISGSVPETRIRYTSMLEVAVSLR